MHYRTYYRDRLGHNHFVTEAMRDTPEGQIYRPLLPSAMCITRMVIAEARVERGKALHECP